MERKYPFTSLGLDELTADLYVQDDAYVEAEATKVEQNFFNWMESVFDLAPSQVDYMYSLGPAFAEETGSKVAFNFRQRYPVTMTKGEASTRSIKYIREEAQRTATYVPNEETKHEGGLHFYIS